MYSIWKVKIQRREIACVAILRNFKIKIYLLYVPYYLELGNFNYFRILLN